jgi:hypothetical protein
MDWDASAQPTRQAKPSDEACSAPGQPRRTLARSVPSGCRDPAARAVPKRDQPTRRLRSFIGDIRDMEATAASRMGL